MHNINATLSLIEDALESALEDRDQINDQSFQCEFLCEASNVADVSEFTLPMHV